MFSISSKFITFVSICTKDEIMRHLNTTNISNLAKCCREMRDSTIKQLAACKIMKLIYIRQTETWVNQILCKVLTLHPFSNRIRIKNAPINRFEGGLPNLYKHMKKTKHVSLTNYLMCECGNEAIIAKYYSIGWMKAYTSTPYLDFVCVDCSLYESDEDDETWEYWEGSYYQYPRVARYPLVEFKAQVLDRT